MEMTILTNSKYRKVLVIFEQKERMPKKLRQRVLIQAAPQQKLNQQASQEHPILPSLLSRARSGTKMQISVVAFAAFSGKMKG